MVYFVNNYLNRTGRVSNAFLLPPLSTISSFGYSKRWAKQPAHPTCVHPLNQKYNQQHLVVHTGSVKGLNRGLSMSKQTATAKFSLILLGISLSLLSVASLAGTVSQSPLFLTSTVKPNIMLMVDNSGSMSEKVEYTPKAYDPGTIYFPAENCANIPMKNATSSTIDLNSESLCSANGGVWTPPSRRRSGRCDPRTASVSTPITYGTTIPTDFLGNVTKSGKTTTTGKLCFAPNLSYTVSTGVGIPSSVTGNANRANYLNWYYKELLDVKNGGDTRLNIAKASAIELVGSLDNDVRIGLTSFDNPSSGSQNTQGGKLIEAINDLSATKKTNVINAINSLKAESWTPLAETTATIGKYFATGYNGTVTLYPQATGETTQAVAGVLPRNLVDGTSWRTVAGSEPSISTPPIQYSCQRSFNLLITDGLPTQDQEISASLKDYDRDCTDNPSLCLTMSPNYDLKKAFYPTLTDPTKVPGNTSDYLDDVATALEDIDLRPDLTKKLDSSGKPKTKNNVVTYGIGFADSDINPTLPGVNPILRDAAIQGGGEFFYAANASELSASLQRTFSAILRQDAAASSVAANSSQFQTNTVLYQALFESGSWSGNIRAFDLLTEDINHNGILDIPPAVSVSEDKNGNGELDSGEISTVERWNAASRIPPASERQIFSYDPVGEEGIEFLWSNLNNVQKAVLDNANIANSSSLILDYLRGVRSKEGGEPGDFRTRLSLLGDIVNSDPLFVGGQDLGYSSFSGTEGSTYAAHVVTKKENDEVIYVGANDGMLHAFFASVGGLEGKEIFAYVPNSLISVELASLADQNYSHQYFVDGAPQYGDAFYDSAWHSVLVGSMGAGSTSMVANAGDLVTGTGGRALFALDITDPSSFQASDVLWEFSNRHDADLGYTLAPPSVVRMANGEWAAIVANGYNSSAGKAALFILNIKTGALIKKIIAEGTVGSNGLSSPTPVDVDGDKIIDYIYAGDLKGNMWKFDVTSTNPAQWQLANSGIPLYVACTNNTSPCAAANLQPITLKPAVVEAKEQDQTTGVMVFFGTGKYYENGDHQLPIAPALPQIQSIYAIWDICDKSNVATCTSGVVSGRSQLVEQKILSDGPDFRFTSACQIAYGTVAPSIVVSGCDNSTSRKGWFMDLNSPSAGGQGERAVSAPIVRQNSVLFTTLIPINIICEPDGTGYIMDMDINGARFVSPSLDVNGDGKVDDTDLQNGMTVTGIKSKNGIIKTPTIVGNGEGALENLYFNSSSSKVLNFRRCPPGGCKKPPVTGGSRRSWRQLF
jgi:type IV pilus assembly protein PilY1